MQIKSIKIKNLKSIGGKIQEFSFPLGINLINGDVGCGKTTVFTAVVYALFNKNTDFKGNSKSTLPIGKLINDVNKKELLVELELDNGYLIKRGMKPDIFEIWKDGLNLANKSVTIDQDFLEQTVLEGLNFEIFLSTVYLSNKPGSIPFLHMTQTQRKEYIEKILDLRRIYFYNENLKKYIAENKLERASLDKELSLLEETITNEEFNIKTQKQKQEIQKQKLEQYNTEHQERLDKQTVKIKELKGQKDKLQDELDTYQVPEDEKRLIQDKIKIIQDKIQEIENQDYSSTTQDEKDIQDKIDKSAQDKKDKSFELDMKQAELKDKDIELLDTQDLLFEQLKKDIQDIQDKSVKLNTIKVQKQAEYDAFVNSKENYHFCGTCPTLEKIVGSFDVPAYQSFALKAEETLNTFNEQLAEKNQIIKNIEQIREHNIKINQDKSRLEAEIKNIQDKITYMINETQSLKDQLAQFKINKINQDKLKIDNLKQQIEIQDKELQNIEETNKSKLRQEIKVIEQQIESSIEMYTAIEQEPVPEVQEVSETYLHSLYEKKEQLNHKIEDEYNHSVELEDLKKEINSPEHKAKAIQKYMPIFEDKLNLILDKFMEEDVFDLKAKLDSEFELTFYKNGKEISVFTLSSGQVACCSLACTFAFLNLLEVKHQTRFGHILLDELLDTAIGSRIVKVLEYLKSISINKNISVISHNKTLDHGMFETVTTVTKGDLFSEYSIS